MNGAMIYCEGEEIGVEDLDPALARTGSCGTAALPSSELGPEQARIEAGETLPSSLELESLEKDAIKRALERCGGNRSKAALELGLSRADRSNTRSSATDFSSRIRAVSRQALIFSPKAWESHVPYLRDMIEIVQDDAVEHLADGAAPRGDRLVPSRHGEFAQCGEPGGLHRG